MKKLTQNPQKPILPPLKKNPELKKTGFKKFESKKKIEIKNNLENFVEKANLSKNDFFSEKLKKDINKWFGNMSENSLHMKIIIYLKKKKFKKKKKKFLKKKKNFKKSEIF